MDVVPIKERLIVELIRTKHRIRRLSGKSRHYMLFTTSDLPPNDYSVDICTLRRSTVTRADGKEVIHITDLSGGFNAAKVPFTSTKEELDRLIARKFRYTNLSTIEASAFKQLPYPIPPACTCTTACAHEGACGPEACNHHIRNCEWEECLNSVHETWTVTPTTKQFPALIPDPESPGELFALNIVECGADCACFAEGCPHRILLSPAAEQLQFAIKSSGTLGLGVFAMQDIAANSFICEYVGIFGHRQHAKRTINRPGSNSTTNINEYLYNVSDEWIIDADRNGNLSRFLNHSCASNAAAHFYFLGHTFAHFCRIVFVARVPIPTGVQITIDYGIGWWMVAKMICKCNTPECLYSEDKWWVRVAGRKPEEALYILQGRRKAKLLSASKSVAPVLHTASAETTQSASAKNEFDVTVREQRHGDANFCEPAADVHKVIVDQRCSVPVVSAALALNTTSAVITQSVPTNNVCEIIAHEQHNCNAGIREPAVNVPEGVVHLRSSAVIGPAVYPAYLQASHRFACHKCAGAICSKQKSARLEELKAKLAIANDAVKKYYTEVNIDVNPKTRKIRKTTPQEKLASNDRRTLKSQIASAESSDEVPLQIKNFISWFALPEIQTILAPEIESHEQVLDIHSSPNVQRSIRDLAATCLVARIKFTDTIESLNRSKVDLEKSLLQALSKHDEYEVEAICDYAVDENAEYISQLQTAVSQIEIDIRLNEQSVINTDNVHQQLQVLINLAASDAVPSSSSAAAFSHSLAVPVVQPGSSALGNLSSSTSTVNEVLYGLSMRSDREPRQNSSVIMGPCSVGHRTKLRPSTQHTGSHSDRTHIQEAICTVRTHVPSLQRTMLMQSGKKRDRDSIVDEESTKISKFNAVAGTQGNFLSVSLVDKYRGRRRSGLE